MIVFRRRLIYWLLKEYLRRWGKTIVFFFLIGLAVFFFLSRASGLFLSKIPLWQNETIGLIGSYTLDNLPQLILSDLSSGLTSVGNDDEIKPNIAKSWTIENNGKRYVFVLRQDLYFNDGEQVTADRIRYNFTDATIKSLGKYKLSFELKESYSPFLVSVSRPVFKKGLVGIGSYSISKVDLNGNFVELITLVNTKDPYKRKTYHFYPDVKSLKTAYMLGEVSTIIGITDLSYNNKSFSIFPNTSIEKKINYNRLVTLFYNTKDNILSDRNVRNGLTFALPNDFNGGKRSYLPYPPSSWIYNDQYVYSQDFEQSRILTKDLRSASESASVEIVVKSLSRYKDTAEVIVSVWKQIGIKSKVEVVDSIPANFQVFLGDFYVPKDPDQYRLWHSAQDTNISRYENKRIDKLLEDGRKTIDVTLRNKYYSDFQKYLLADAPAAFLYFPYEYEVKRK